MGIFLKILGIVFLVVICAVFFLFLYLRKKWNVIKELGNSFMPPAKIHLNENLDPEWLEDKDAQDLLKSLAAVGFTKGKAYDIVEMPQMQMLSLFNDPKTMVAILYAHEQGFHWVDIVIEYEDGSEITTTNAPSGGELEVRPGTRKIFMPKASVEDLYAAMTGALDSKPLKKINNDTFRQTMEESYQKDMAWRIQKGGVSEEEIRRIAENADIDLDDDEYEEAIKEIKLKEILTWHDACIETSLEERGVPEEEWEVFKEQCFIVNEDMHPEAFLEYLEAYLDISETTLRSFEKLIPEMENSGELFSRINATFSPDLRAKKIGEVDRPIRVNIYQAPR